jgi:uncharacterized protein YhaN
MRLHRFDVQAFGRLQRFAASDLSEHQIIVMHGRNEAGKSTFLEFVTTMLYGFAPADRARHPYAPWSGETLEGSADFKLKDARVISVQRRLRDAPMAKLWQDDQETDLGNAPLPFLGPISRQLYRRFHALSIETLEDLDAEAWKALEERLLGGSNLEYVRAVREALSGIQQRADALWQANPRGVTRHRRVALAVRRLLRERDAAVARAARVSELRDLIAARTWHIETTETQLLELRTRLDHAQTLAPMLRSIKELDDLRRRAEQRLPTDDLPADARGQLTGLRQDVADNERATNGARRELESLEQQSRLTPEIEAVLGVESEVRALVSEAAVHQQDVVHINDLEREYDANEALFVEHCNSVFTKAPDAEVREALARLTLSELQASQRTWEDHRRLPQQAQEEVTRAAEGLKAAEEDLALLPSPESERNLRQREEALRQLQAREDLLAALQSDIKAAKAQAAASGVQALKSKYPAGPVAQGIGLLLASGALIATLALKLSEAWWLLGPVALGLLAAGVITLRNRSNKGLRAPDEMRADKLARECLAERAKLELHEYETFVGHLERAQQALALLAQRAALERRLVASRQRFEKATKHVEASQQKSQQTMHRISEVLQGLPVLPERLADPRQDLITALSELRTALRELTRLQGERDAVSRRAREREARAARLAETMDVKLSGSAMDAVPLWYDTLQRALKSRHRTDDAVAALPAARTTLEEAERRLEAGRAELAAVESRLSALDTEGGTVEAGLHWLEQARTWRNEAAEIERQLHVRFPDWVSRADEARAASIHGESLDLDTEKRLKLAQQIEQLEQGLGQLFKERDGLRSERDRLASRRSLGDIDGALAGLQETGDRIARKRDRLALVGDILLEGDARWRDRCQPQVLRSASNYLRGITSGAWDRLHTEPHEDGTKLFVTMQKSGRQVPVGTPLSRALRRQIHLALRLAIAEQLDQGEPLPLVLDDVLIDWDASRSGRGVEVLSGIAERRQVILITGNSELAESLAGQAGACVLALPERTGDEAAVEHGGALAPAEEGQPAVAVPAGASTADASKPQPHSTT